jgi:broad-specificity NMP kinase
VRIAISGSVGSGKTTIASLLGEKLGYRVISLNDLSEEYKIKDVLELETFDFDIDNFLDDFEDKLKREAKEDLIIESHFTQFIDPKLMDVLFVISRDLKLLKKEYEKRGYNKRKVRDNLEVESFNLCFYEAEERGYEIDNLESEKEYSKKNYGRVFLVENNDNIEEPIKKILGLIDKLS